MTIRDPCVSRFAGALLSAAGKLVAGTGLTVEKMPSSGRHTVCCGEGGAAGCFKPDLADAWGKRRSDETAGRRAITYCAAREPQARSLHRGLVALIDLSSKQTGQI